FMVEYIKKRDQVSFRSNIKYSLLLVMMISLSSTNKILPKEIHELKDQLHKSRLTGKYGPINAFIKIMQYDYKKEAIDPSKLSEVHFKEAEKYGFYFYGSGNIGYPLLKDYIYKGEKPFETIKSQILKPNIIVFFTEGFSARELSLYNPQYKELTPNIDKFSTHEKVMIVDHYYNHTAATYRGLLGQLCSIYPTYGGIGGWHTSFSSLPKMEYLSLNNIFNRNNYDTVFFDSHRKDAAYLDELLKKIGFKNVWNAEEMSKDFLEGEEPLRSDALSDHQLMRALIGFMKKREKLSEGTPLFLGLYNLETHTWQEPAKDGLRYGDGSNNVLNIAHNFDDAFESFWEYFKNSSYFEDTIFIFTADHCHYPTENIIKMAGEGFQPLFVDQIPLMIYDPVHRLPKNYDANYSTTIDFAPSLIHLLGFPNHKNTFLGESLFSRQKREYYGKGLSVIGESYFLIEKEMIHLDTSPVYTNNIRLLKNIIGFTQYIETSNQLWKREWNDIFINPIS
ncbi:MAG: sulfatase-like hydrolase/transferase, partial [bacterium]